ncbi:hypothetical protein TNCV_871341 [Trichonephila clavipes]|nr:hypothetical protein TNCV_871341 [Trichonephila clavipes]
MGRASGVGRRIPFDFQRTSVAGLALDSANSSGLERAPALQCRTPSRHHLELQDRRDYTPADRAARTCWFLMSANPCDVQVEKLECIGLIQKCMGTYLLDLERETEKSKLSDGKKPKWS